MLGQEGFTIKSSRFRRSVDRETEVDFWSLRRADEQSQFSTMLELEPTSERMRHVRDFAREHLRESLSVDLVAEIAGISSGQFARIFVEETSDTPAQAIERLLAEAALPQIQGRF